MGQDTTKLILSSFKFHYKFTWKLVEKFGIKKKKRCKIGPLYTKVTTLNTELMNK